MGQSQDPQHEEIHGQQEVDVFLGEYLRRKYKKKQVRIAKSPKNTLEASLQLGAGRKTLRLQFHSYGEGQYLRSHLERCLDAYTCDFICGRAIMYA